MPFLEFRRVLRSEEHTSELQSHDNIVCRLLLEKKKRLLGEDQADARAALLGFALWRGVQPECQPGPLVDQLGAARFFFFLMIGRPRRSPLFPSPALFR